MEMKTEMKNHETWSSGPTWIKATLDDIMNNVEEDDLDDIMNIGLGGRAGNRTYLRFQAFRRAASHNRYHADASVGGFGSFTCPQPGQAITRPLSTAGSPKGVAGF